MFDAELRAPFTIDVWFNESDTINDSEPINAGIVAVFVSYPMPYTKAASLFRKFATSSSSSSWRRKFPTSMREEHMLTGKLPSSFMTSALQDVFQSSPKPR
jgi:hypothetical protein